MFTKIKNLIVENFKKIDFNKIFKILGEYLDKYNKKKNNSWFF